MKLFVYSTKKVKNRRNKIKIRVINIFVMTLINASPSLALIAVIMYIHVYLYTYVCYNCRIAFWFQSRFLQFELLGTMQQVITVDYRRIPHTGRYMYELYLNWEVYQNHDCLSPRMAYRLCFGGGVMKDLFTDCPEVWFDDVMDKDHPYYDMCLQDKEWIKSFIHSIERVLMRLQKGIGLAPNCIAEVRAINLIVEYCKNQYIIADEAFNEEHEVPFWCGWELFNGLPLHQPRDKHKSKDIDFESLLLNATRNYHNIHPERWFLCFDVLRIIDHYISRKNITKMKSKHRCMRCHQSKDKMYRCSKCHKIKRPYYCSKHCQKIDWKIKHKYVCEYKR
eukprot:591821_1